MTQAAALDAAILDAHETGDGAALARLYAQAADVAEAAEDLEQTTFFLTQAYVFALEAGSPDAAILNRRLAAYGSDELQADLD